MQREEELKGDPTKPGLYTMLLRVGPNTRIEAYADPANDPAKRK